MQSDNSLRKSEYSILDRCGMALILLTGMVVIALQFRSLLM